MTCATPHGQGARAPRADRLLIAGVLAAAAFLLVNLLAFPYGRDQGIYAVIAETMLRGGVPYRDAWDFKPPGIFFIYAAARGLFGAGMYAPRILEAVGLAALLPAGAILSRRFVGCATPGLLGGALAVLSQVRLEFWHTGQPENFAAAAIAWALVAATYEPRNPSARMRRIAAWLTAGALYGVAGLMKPPLVGGVVVSIAAVTQRRRRCARPAERAGLEVAPVLCFAAGAALSIVLVIVYFGAAGALRDAFDALFVFAPQYTALGWRNARLDLGLLRPLYDVVVSFSSAVSVGVLLMLALPVLSPRERDGWWHLLGVIAVVLIGVALQAKFFHYHYAAAITLMSLLAGWGWWKVWLRARASLPATCALLAYFVMLVSVPIATDQAGEGFWERCGLRVVALLNPSERAAIHNALYSMPDMNTEANRRAADWLRAETPADASVYIWGFEPVVYDWAQRRPASRFIYNVPQRAAWSSAQARETLMQDLAATPPAAILIERRDRMAWVTGNDSDSAEVLETFPALQALLAAAYEPAGQITSFDAYRRRMSVAVGSSS